MFGIIISKLLKIVKTVSLCFSQFPFNLTHVSALSLKAPTALMASLSSFTHDNLKKQFSASGRCYQRCGIENIYYLLSLTSVRDVFKKKVMKLSQFALGRRCVHSVDKSGWKSNKVFLSAT